jgi:hypothetical protein
VCLDELDRAGVHSSVLIRGAKGSELTFDTWRQRAFGRAVVRRPHPLDHRVDTVAVPYRVIERSQDGKGTALAEHEPVRTLIERPAHAAL